MTEAIGSGACAGSVIMNPDALGFTSSPDAPVINRADTIDPPNDGTSSCPSAGQLKTCKYSLPGLRVARPHDSCAVKGLALVP